MSGFLNTHTQNEGHSEEDRLYQRAALMPNLRVQLHPPTMLFTKTELTYEACLVNRGSSTQFCSCHLAPEHRPPVPPSFSSFSAPEACCCGNRAPSSQPRVTQGRTSTRPWFVVTSIAPTAQHCSVL